MMEVDKLVLSAYEIAMAREAKTVNRRGFGFRGKSVDTDDDDDSIGGGECDVLPVRVVAFALEEEANGSDTLAFPLLTGPKL